MFTDYNYFLNVNDYTDILYCKVFMITLSSITITLEFHVY